MTVSSSTDDGFPVDCDVCGTSSIVSVSRPPGDSVCPNCGSFLWVKAVAEICSRNQFVPDLRITDLNAGDRDSVIREMVDAVVAAKRWSRVVADELFNAVLKREHLGSTSIGRGFAIPHATHDKIEDSVATLAYLPSPVDFDSADGQLVHTVVLLVSPKTQPGLHLRALEKIARALRYLR